MCIFDASLTGNPENPNIPRLKKVPRSERCGCEEDRTADFFRDIQAGRLLFFSRLYFAQLFH
jgi:hypothetical protein